MFRLNDEEGLVTLTLDRPTYNTLDPGFVGRLAEACRAATERPEVRVLHLRSAARSFCAGVSLQTLRDWENADLDSLERLNAAIEGLPAITLAEIGGACVGAGLGLALACDLRIAADEARFGVPEAPAGVVPLGDSLRRLTAVAGAGTAFRLFATAELVGGREAATLGLVAWSVPRPELPSRAAALARRIAALPKSTLLAAKAQIAGRAPASERQVMAMALADLDAQDRFAVLLKEGRART